MYDLKDVLAQQPQERAAARTPVDPDFRAGVELLVEEVRRLADALDARRTSVADGD